MLKSPLSHVPPLAANENTAASPDHPPPLPSRRADSALRSALGLLDEAVHRLRLAPRGTLAVYYVGTLPFMLALLCFWMDQSRSSAAPAHNPVATLGVTLLFVAMKIAHAMFVAGLHAPRSRHEAALRWPPARLGRLALVQTVIQGPGLFVLNAPSVMALIPAPGALVFLASLVLTLPLGWVYAFFQNVTVFGDGETSLVRAVLARAFRAALRQPRQNHVALSVLSLLGLFIWLNLLVGVVGLPSLLHLFTGNENVFTRHGPSLFNPTFYAVTIGLIYLALDPLAKTFYLLRCFPADFWHVGTGSKATSPPYFQS